MDAAHLLIVDDDERIRVLLQKFLMRSGFLVSAARDAAHARRILSGLEFDLIVLDVMMPGEDGVSLCRDLRKTIATPILLLTAKSETADRINGLEAGADDYLAKPFEPKELRTGDGKPTGRFLAPNLTRTDLTGANLTEVDLTKATLERTIFAGAVLEGTKLPERYARLQARQPAMPGGASASR